MLSVDVSELEGRVEDLLEERLKEEVEENRVNYNSLIAKWFARSVLEGEKCVIDHSLDPPWDDSGRVVNTSEMFDISDYSKVDHFLEEYTGASRASFISGMGMFHDIYRDDLQEITEEWVLQRLESAIKSLVLDNNAILKEWVTKLEGSEFDFTVSNLDDIVCLIHEETEVLDHTLLISINLVEKIGNTDAKILFQVGKKAAYEQIQKDQESAEKAARELERRRVIAERVWDKVEKRYRLRYGKNIPKKIEKPVYDSEVKAVLSDLASDGEDIEHIRYLAYLRARFSNSVAMLIQGFNI